MENTDQNKEITVEVAYASGILDKFPDVLTAVFINLTLCFLHASR